MDPDPYPGGPKDKNMWIRIRNYGRKYYKLSTSERVQLMLFLKESAYFVDAGSGKPLIITIFLKFHLIFISSIKFFLMLFELPYFLVFG
jgi:hypothetical protein